MIFQAVSILDDIHLYYLLQYKDQHFKINIDVICFLICTPYFDFTSCPYNVFCNQRKPPFTCYICQVPLSPITWNSSFVFFNLGVLLTTSQLFCTVSHNLVLVDVSSQLDSDYIYLSGIPRSNFVFFSVHHFRRSVMVIAYYLCYLY